MADSTTLPGRLKEAQKKAGLDNRALAAAVGVHPVTVSQWRSGKQAPIGDTLKRVATALGVDPIWLEHGAIYQAVPEGGRTVREPLAGDAEATREDSVELPRQLELMALDFEREAVAAGGDRPFLRFARARLRDPHLLAMFAGGYNDKPMSAEEQRAEFEAVIAELRSGLKRRIRRLGLRPDQ